MTILAETGTNIQANKNGLLKNISDAPKVAPFQPWARDLFTMRQQNRLADDPQYLYCLPPGGPRQFQEAYGVQFVEDKDHQRIFVFVGSVVKSGKTITNVRGEAYAFEAGREKLIATMDATMMAVLGRGLSG